jgi:hypothetical protein
LAYLFILAGAAPLLRSLYWWQTHSLVPLKVSLPVRSGEYAFPFKVDLDSYYRIQVRVNSSAGFQIDPCPGVDVEKCHKVDLNWKILTDSGDVVKEGAFTVRPLLSGGVQVGMFDAKRGSRLRMDLTVHREINGAKPADAQLSVEEGSDMGVGLGMQLELGVVWAVILAGGGMALLSFLSRQRETRGDLQ